MLTHLGRELTHAVLRLILGGSFADAHKHSRCVKCGDGIWRRWLLRLLLHSADYKEKYVFLSTCRYNVLTVVQGFVSNDKKHGNTPVSPMQRDQKPSPRHG